MPTLVSDGIKNGKQKGPGTDASMITAMKRNAVILANTTDPTRPNGAKGLGPIVDSQRTRGFTDSGVIPRYIARGLNLSFFRVL